LRQAFFSCHVVARGDSDAAVTTPVGQRPVGVAAGQFNSGTDSFPDLVVLYDRSSLALWLGDGAGGSSCSPTP
jgi:hypothetical protein